MIVNGDIKGLEVVIAADWYDDKILKQEVIDKVNFHADNMARFSLPDRVTAKRLMFKTLYGGSPFGFANDADFLSVGYTEKQWAVVLEQFYDKYHGVKKGQERDIAFVKEHQYLEIPSGRYYVLEPRRTPWGLKWPETYIKNYPIQGFGADMVKLLRIELFRMWEESGLEGEFIGTIHDSLIYDVPEKNVQAVVDMMYKTVDKAQELCYTIYKYSFSLPLQVEVLVGTTKSNLKEI